MTIETLPLDPHRELVRLATAPNPVIAHIWQQGLEDEGITCKVLGDYLDAGLGDISGVSAELWVDPFDFDRAERILREHAEHEPALEDEDEESETAIQPM